MADTLKEKADQVAESAYLKLTARVAMVIASACLPIVMAVGGFGLNRVVAGIDEITHKINALEQRFAKAETDQSNLDRRVTEHERGNTDRFSAQGRRIDKLDTDMDDMKKRVYPLGRRE